MTRSLDLPRDPDDPANSVNGWVSLAGVLETERELEQQREDREFEMAPAPRAGWWVKHP